MKIFILGLSKSGKTTVSKALCSQSNINCVSPFDWFKNSFRCKSLNESDIDYQKDFQNYLTNSLKKEPTLFSNYIESCCFWNEEKISIIDGMLDPKNFIDVFDWNTDMLVVLNRLDNNSDNDYDHISLNVIRDYCFWLSNSGLMPKDRWQEFNFKFNGLNSEHFKKIGAKNTLWIVHNIEKVIEILKQSIIDIA